MGTSYDFSRAIRRQRFGLRTRDGVLWCRAGKCPFHSTCDHLEKGTARVGEPCAWLAEDERMYLLAARVELGAPLEEIPDWKAEIMRGLITALLRLGHTARAVAHTDITVKREVETPVGIVIETRRSPEMYHYLRANRKFVKAFREYKRLWERITAENS